MNIPIKPIYAVLFAAVTFGACGNQDPNDPGANIDPVVHPFKAGTSNGSSGDRGDIMINEVGFAGSICKNQNNEFVYDPDDVFIELLNKHLTPINFSGWRINISGDYNHSFIIPKNNITVPTNGFFVIAAKKGAFKADVVIPGLQLGKHILSIELRDIGNKLIDGAGSTSEEVFTGGYDTETVRSMERTTAIFSQRGDFSRNWHAYSDDNIASNIFPDHIKPACQERTLATPGEGNSPDYSGNSDSGDFE